MNRTEFLHEMAQIAHIATSLKDKDIEKCKNRECQLNRRLILRGWRLLDIAHKYLPKEGELQ